ncbi:hypothetical protein [Pseudomonas jessenii]|jgi:hypothetical protein|nr:hypothetical protein [Pseudomonas jessenii]
MNDKTLGQPLKDDSKRTAPDVTWLEFKKYSQVGNIYGMAKKRYEVVGKEYLENEDGTYHIQLSTREV